MVAVQTKDVNRMHRKRSVAYVRHAKSLLEMAERELITPEGRWISVEGLNRLKRKINTMAAC